jgi:hypothetical protein
MYSRIDVASSGKLLNDCFKIDRQRKLIAQLNVDNLRAKIIANITIGTALKAGWVTSDDAERRLAHELAEIDEPAPAREKEAVR